MSKTGRPAIEVTDEVLKKAEQFAAQGMTIEQIAQSLGWGYSTLRHKKKAFKRLQRAIEKGQAQGIAVITNALFKNAQEGNLGAQCFYLKNRAGWKDQTQTTLDASEETIEALAEIANQLPG